MMLMCISSVMLPTSHAKSFADGDLLNIPGGSVLT